jgi:cobalamin biosynthesis Mg chelatase CobN
VADTDIQDTRPVPDPTVLTTEASVRLEAMIRNLISSEITHLEVLFDQKLAEIKTQLKMLDARTAEQKKDTKDALDAALAAQKEAVASQTASSEKSITKSETATTERIKGVEAQQATSSKAMDDKISDLKDRVVAIESIKLGNTEQTANMRAGGMDTRGNMASIMSVIMAIIAVASIIIAIIIALKP